MRTDTGVVSHSIHTDGAIFTLVIHTIVNIHLTELTLVSQRTHAAVDRHAKVNFMFLVSVNSGIIRCAFSPEAFSSLFAITGASIYTWIAFTSADRDLTVFTL